MKHSALAGAAMVSAILLNTLLSAADIDRGITYQGRLDQNGAAFTGTGDLLFTLFDAPIGGRSIGNSPFFDNAPIVDGLFTLELDFGGGGNVFNGAGRWIEVSVNGVTLSPRQKVTAAPAARTLRPGAIIRGVPYETLTVENTGVEVGRKSISGRVGNPVGFGFSVPIAIEGINNTASGFGVYGYSLVSSGVRGDTDGASSGVFGNASAATGEAFGVRGHSNSPAGAGVIGYNLASIGNDSPGVHGITQAPNGCGVLGQSSGISGTNCGVRGETASSDGQGVVGISTMNTLGSFGSGLLGVAFGGNANGVVGECSGSGGSGSGVVGSTSSAGGYGGSFFNTGSGVTVYAQGNGVGRFNATIRSFNIQPAGGICAYFTNDSTFANCHFFNAGTGEVLYLQNGGDAAGANGGDFITCLNEAENDRQFRVLSSGEARSDVGFFTPAADFAEMLPAGEPELEAGDVLVIGTDGELVRCSEPVQRSVAGIYSTAPGFVGGHPVEGPRRGDIPLAVVGVVPVKVTAAMMAGGAGGGGAGGPISPGDLLTTSAIPGHAMRAGECPVVGSIVGKALGAHAQGEGVIRMLVTLQ